MEQSGQSVDSNSVRDAWRCSFCNELIYNRDAAGNPTEGAPIPHFVSQKHKEVCTTCFQLSSIRDNDYWRDVERDIRTARERKAEKIKKLSGDKDYFTGA